MNNQLLMYFTNTKLLSDNQHGFRPHRSTEYAALEIVDRITTHLNNNKLPISIFLDLSKAFDKLDRTILLKKLLDSSLVSTLGSFTNGTNNTNTEHMINTELYNIAEWLKLNKLSLKIST